MFNSRSGDERFDVIGSAAVDPHLVFGNQLASILEPRLEFFYLQEVKLQFTMKVRRLAQIRADQSPRANAASASFTTCPCNAAREASDARSFTDSHFKPARILGRAVFHASEASDSSACPSPEKPRHTSGLITR